MATEVEIKAKERKEILDEIKRKRAATAQSEGIIGAAERGEYGDVGQGGEKGPFDDEVNQDPGDEDVTQSRMSYFDFLKNYFTDPKLSLTGAAIDLFGRTGAATAPYTQKTLETISQGGDNIVQKAGKFLFEDAAKVAAKINSGVSFDELTPGEKFAIASVPAEAIPGLGLAPDILKLAKNFVVNAGKAGVKAIEDITQPVGITNEGMIMPMAKVKNPGAGSGMPGMGGTGGGAGLSEKGLRLAEQRSYVNKKLKEIYDEAPIDPETNLPMLNTNWFSSKETIEKIYKSNPKLFPEWKDGIGNWNSLTPGFLAGKFKKVKGKRVYTGDKVDSASKLVSGADSPAKKATKDFEKAVAKKLNVDSINPQEQTLKYLNFIRLSESDELVKNSDKFFKKYNFDDLTTPGTKLNENFEKFKILDDKRKVLRDDPAIQAVIKKIFPDTEVKFDVAHTFELGQVKKGKVSKSKLGKGGDPDEMYIDLSITNRSIQKDLESKAKQLEEIYTQTGDSEILEALQKISKKMSDLGVKGETVTKVGDLQSGFILGKKGENLSDKLQALAERQGVKLTDADYEILLKADNLINPPRPFKDGGMVGISHLTRPLGNF
tara:strand:+ start:40 stop:1851 length:1812 start_codon:yes stop_codon:yes gene_type:complete